MKEDISGGVLTHNPFSVCATVLKYNYISTPPLLVIVVLISKYILKNVISLDVNIFSDINSETGIEQHT